MREYLFFSEEVEKKRINYLKFRFVQGEGKVYRRVTRGGKGRRALKTVLIWEERVWRWGWGEGSF